MSDVPANPPPDMKADAVAQLQEAIHHIDRSIRLLQPMLPSFQQEYDRLRQIRDQMEDTFSVDQTARLRAGKFNFEADVSKLREVVDNLDDATQRSTRAQEIVSYVTLAVSAAAALAAEVVTYLL